CPPVRAVTRRPIQIYRSRCGRVLVQEACTRSGETEDMVRRARGLGGAATLAVLAAAALGISGLPAHAAPAPADRPAPADPGAPRARVHARTAPTHKVPNELLNEALAEDGEDDGGNEADLAAL